MKHSRLKHPRKSPSGWRSLAHSRPLMFGASSAWMAFILVVLVFRLGATTPVEPELRPGTFATSLVEQANELSARGEYDAAVLGYRAAAEKDPENIPLRFALGVALSHAGRQEETADHFRFVVTRGAPGSAEVQLARGWLERAGILAPSVTFAVSRTAQSEAVSTGSTSTPGSAGSGKVRGRTEWAGVDTSSESGWVNIVLEGADAANAEVALDSWVALGQPYAFDSVDPGNYRLTAQMSDVVVWEQEVTVEAGRAIVVDLNQANSLVASSDLPRLGR